MKTLIELITGMVGQTFALRVLLIVLILMSIQDDWIMGIATIAAIWLLERLNYQNGLTDGIVIVSKLNDGERKKLKDAIEEIERE